MSQLRNGWIRRLFTLLVCALLCAQPAFAMGETAPAAQPVTEPVAVTEQTVQTETPKAEVTLATVEKSDAPSVEKTEATATPTATPTAAPTATPKEVTPETAAPTEAPSEPTEPPAAVDTPSPEISESPTVTGDSPTETATAPTDTGETPTETPLQTEATPGATTALPTEATATPTATPSATPTATPAATDQAPVCKIPNCPHITVDANGNLVALCPLGEWMIAHGLGAKLSMTATMALFTSTEATTIALTDGVTTMYRSGTYVLTGGTGSSDVVINANLAVAVELKGASIRKLTVNNGASVQLAFVGKNRVAKMHTGTGSILMNATGSLIVNAIDDPGKGRLTMAGGSIALPAGTVSQNGRNCYSFNATGATAAMVDSKAFPFSTPDSAGVAHLWLPAPDAGNTYRSSVTGGVLVVQSAPDEPSGPQVYYMDSAADLDAAAGQSYAILPGSGTVLEHRLKVNQSGVSLVFHAVDFSAAANVEAGSAARLFINGQCKLKSITAGAAINLSGSGTLDVTTLAVNTLNCANTVRLRFGTSTGSCFAGWQSLVSPVDLSGVDGLTFNNQKYAVAYSPSSPTALFTPLPAPSSGMMYHLELNGATLEATQVPAGTTTLTVGAANLNIGSSGSYVILSESGATGGIVIKDGVTADLIFRSVHTSGKMSVGSGAKVNLSLVGSNSLGAVALGESSSLALSGRGALLTGGISAGKGSSTTVNASTNVSLKSGSSLGGSALVPTVINVTDGGAGSLSGKAITLRIGTGEPFRTTTAADGHVTLWGRRKVSNASVVVLSQDNTYADILTGDPANPDALPEISNVVIHQNSYVTFTADNAQTVGVQYYVNRPNVTMPDTFDPDASVASRLYGEVNFPNVKKDDLITFRVYAARGSGQTLSAATADAFQFSQMYSFTVEDQREQFTLANQNKEYDLYAFRFASGLIPKGATVTYYQNGSQLSGAPSDVGNYTAAVVIPEGNSTYYPTKVTVKVTVAPKVVWIYPESTGKIMGEPDPEVAYTYSDMFGNDKVTGTLTHAAGETYGNYPYYTTSLSAPSYYVLKIDPDSPMFFVDWKPGHYIKVDPLSIIDPVHQVIQFTDGIKLDMLLHTTDKLNISKVAYGMLVMDTETRKNKPFTPELRLKRGYNQAMIILQAEPEINSDGGYATDEDGNVQLRARTLSLSAFHLNRFRSQNITALGFRLGNAMCTLDLSDLISEKVRDAMAQAGMPALGTHYQITLTPVNSVSDLLDYPVSVQDAKALGAQMMGMRIELQNGSTVLDVSQMIPSARMMFDASELLAAAGDTSPEITEVAVGRKDGQTGEDSSLTTDVMELVQKLMLEKLKTAGVTLNYYADKAETLDSQLVVPYTASETEALPFTAVMKTSPFLMAKYTRNGLYSLGQSSVE